ncbi:arylsulfatase [Actinocorallia sp. B10E7]|uniref:arylsulfatase n=1 Tax=Actinocorallia sp. B10E7 TaxID=3153558 RepID=UPI00325D3E27
MAEAATGRRRFLRGLGGLTATAAALAAWPSGAGPVSSTAKAVEKRQGRARGDRPNFVVIVADDVGIGELGSYGQRKMKTPNLDRMARQGLRFTDGYSAAPVCAPARASLLTGLHAGHSPVRRNPPPGGDLPLNGLPTVGTILQQRGYRTGLFGKWGFGRDQISPDHPNDNGFDDFYGYLTHHSAHSYYPPHLWKDQQKVELPGNNGDSGGLFGPDLIMDEAVKFLGKAKKDPFLLIVAPNLAHAPSVVPKLGAYASQSWKYPNKVHAAQISRLDRYVGILLDRLKALKLIDNTIVLFTSDNGPHEEKGVNPDFFNGNGRYRGYKRNLYEGGIRVPFIAWSPKLLTRTAGKTTGHPAIQYDIPSTLADFADAPVPDGLDGLSLRRVLEGRGDAPAHRYLYWLRLHVGSTPRHLKEDRGKGKKVAAAVRFGDWKVIGFGPTEDYTQPGQDWTYELYNLKKDPGETRDLAAKNRKLVKRGETYLREAWLPN